MPIQTLTKSDMSNRILIIGNGFDIAFGYQTRYADFITAMRSSFNRSDDFPFVDIINKCDDSKESLHRHFYNYCKYNQNTEGRVLWIDIEKELLNYAKKQKGKILNPDDVNADEQVFRQLVLSLNNYILGTTSRPRGTCLDQNLITLLNALKQSKSIPSVYTFNYTDFKNSISKYVTSQESEKWPITYVHGHVSERNEFGIILGINETLDIPEEYVFLQKINQTRKSYPLCNDMMNADEIIIYGLSMGEIDRVYFKTFFENIKKSDLHPTRKKITILTHGDDSIKSIKRNIQAMVGQLQPIQDKCDLVFINMGEVAEDYDNEHKQDFNQLIQRIQI
jgi:hypothetical protein